MKRKILILILSLVMIISGCSKKTGGSETSGENTKKLKVVTSFYPPYDFVKKIAGDKIEVKNLTQTGDAHSFEPSIKDMEDITNSDLLVINGAGFETWIDQVKKSNENLNILDLSKNLEVINGADSHSHDKNEESNHGHNEKDESHNHGHHHDGKDPHTWLSVENAGKMLKDIKDKLVELDSKNKDFYEKNYEKHIKEFDKLSEEYKKTLKKYEGKSFVVPHQAFNYTIKGFNIKQIGIEGINSVAEPNASKMKEIVELMKKNNIKTVFYEYKQNDNIAKSIASEINGNILPISTLETITPEDMESGDDYLSLMKMNLENLVKSWEQ